MGLINRLFNRVEGKKEMKRDDSLSQAVQVVTASALVGDTSSSREDIRDAYRAMCISTVHRCVSLICDSVASLPFKFKYLKDGIYQDFEGSPFHYLLGVQPNANMSAYDFKYQMVQQCLIGNGNAYIYPRVDFSTGEVLELVLISYGCCSHDAMNHTYTVSDPWNGVFGTFGEDEMVHLFLHSLDGRTGVSTLEFARRTMSIAATGDNETMNRFANGGNVMGFVTNDRSVRGFGEYQDDELIDTATALDQMFRNGKRIASLAGQTDFKQISLSSTDMQFLESRKFETKEICRFFGVNPSFAFEDTASNYKSAETAQTALRTTTLNPILCKIEGEFNRKLVGRSMCCKRKFKFDIKSLFACDLETMAKYQQMTIQSGIYSVNDWRRYEDQPPVEGGDRVLVSTNLAPIDSAKLTGEQKTPTVG